MMKKTDENTLLGTNISPGKAVLKMIFLSHGWDMFSFPGGYHLKG